MPLTSPSQIDRWLKEPSEHQNLEFKEAKTQFDSTKLHRYCVALANEGGGHLVLGVTDRQPRAVVGTQAFGNLVDLAEKLFTAVGFRVEVEEVRHPDGRVIIFHIPPRPRGTAYHLDGAYLMRSGASLVPMSEDRLRRIFAEGQPDWTEQVTMSGMDAQQVSELLDVPKFYELMHLPLPDSRANMLDRLVRERLIDQDNDAYSIRRIGALLLAKRLDTFPDIQRKAPRVIVYEGTSKLEPKLDQVGGRGYAVGFQGLVRHVVAQLPQNEIIMDALRREVKLVPEEIIRELLANALIHQDLTIGGMGVSIEIYRDRVEISNPGEPIVPVERFIDGYQSRNERLADLMRRLGICEERSSGIDKVIAATEALQLPAPFFQEAFNRTLVTIFGPRPFEQMNREDRMRACYQHCALKYVMTERMTNQSLRERFHLPETKSATVSQVIAATIDAGQIKPDIKVGSSRKMARYVPFWA